MELLAVLLVLLVLATPAMAIWAVWRGGRLRRQLEDLARIGAQQNDALHRELLDLRRQVAAFPVIASPPKQAESTPVSAAVAPYVSPITTPVIERAAAPVAPDVKPPATPAPVTHVLPTILPVVETTGEVARETHAAQVHVPAKREEETPRAVEPVAPAATPAVPPHVEPKTVVVPAALAPAPPGAPPHSETPAPPVPPRAVPTPLWVPPSVVLVPSPPPAHVAPPPPPVAPPAAARVYVPDAVPMRASAPRRTAEQRMKSVFAFEEILGTNWLNKIGITLLVLGVAWFGITGFLRLGPYGRVLISYVVSFALLGGGVFVEKRDRYRVLGHTLIGGGWALLFFTTYAMYHVKEMQVTYSETFDLVLMLVVAVAMVVHTLRYRSQVVTGLAFLLAYSTVTLSHDDVYSLSAGVILAAGLVGIVVKMGWYELEVFGILSSYLNHLYWLTTVLHVQVSDASGLLHMEGARGHAFPEYHASTALLLFYWVTFRISYVIRKTKSASEEHVSTAAALLNTLLLLGLMRFQSVHPELAFIALLVIGAMEFGFGQLPITKRRREAFIVLTVLGTALMVTAVPFRVTDNSPVILWLIGGEVLLVAGVMVGEVVFRRLALLLGLLVGGHLVVYDFMDLMVARRSSEILIRGAGVMFGLCAIVFYGNALFVGQRWRQFFSDFPDGPLLNIHSYIGGFAAVSAAWAWLSNDWTALGFAGVMLALAGLGRRLKSFHLTVQYGLIGALTLVRVFVVNLHVETPPPAHVTMRLWTLPVLAAAFYVAAKWSELQDGAGQRPLRGLFAAAGTLLVTLLIGAEVPELWQPLAGIVFAGALLESGHRLRYPVLAWHTHVVAALSVAVAFTVDPGSVHRWHTIPVHAFSALPVVAGAYWIAKRVRGTNPQHAVLAGALYTWAAAALVVWGLNEALPDAWIAVGWIIFAVLLTQSTRWVRYQQLAWQADTVAVCALFRAFTYNLPLEQIFWHGLTLRLVTVVLIAAGLYSIARKPIELNQIQRNPGYAKLSAYFFSSAATALLAVLAWYEAPGGWLAAVWALFALALAVVDRRFELDELGWQAHALAAITLLRSVGVNLYVTDTWHSVSVRLLSLSIVVIVLYALSKIMRMPVEWRTREIHHIYSWAASALVALLMWYELQPQPLSVAVAWAVFGLVLFEYGLIRNTRQFRFQAYVALGAAFARIFFSNLTAGAPGEFWGPRMYTVLPIALILFFVYAQLGPDEKTARDDRDFYFDVLLGYLGTACVAALLYFQFTSEWVVTSWAALVMVLFAVVFVLNRRIFLHQALLLTVGVSARGILHNLFGESYFHEGDWTGRFVVVGAAVALVFACLPFAFRLRARYQGQTLGWRWIGVWVRRPEQLVFFAPTLLLTLMLAIKMQKGMVTVAWGIEGVLIFLLALAVSERSFRLTGLILLLLCVAKVIFLDVWRMESTDRYVTFIVLGAALLLVSFLYTRYREKIRQYL